MQPILTVALRYGALYVPDAEGAVHPALQPGALQLLEVLHTCGYTLSEGALHAVNACSSETLATIAETLQAQAGLQKNWTPLVRGWNVPTGETVLDHVRTQVASIWGADGTELPCGHCIPDGSFPLERYNGCPFCGTPFTGGPIEHYKQGSSLRVLGVWRDADAQACLLGLLQARTAPDATEADSLKLLLGALPLPSVEIRIKETVMLVANTLLENGREAEAGALFRTAPDLLRYLWYRHTGFLRVIPPRVLQVRYGRNHRHVHAAASQEGAAVLLSGALLRLRYSRAEGRIYAGWINALPATAIAICESMHPKREMWVRFIRALRLGEWAKRPGFEKLAEVLDRFYRSDYPVWMGAVDAGRRSRNAAPTLRLLQQRPGLFARSLFANMLWFGEDATCAAFAAVAAKVPARLLVTLAMYAEDYFDRSGQRVSRSPGGAAKILPPQPLLALYTDEALANMRTSVRQLALDALRARYAAAPAAGPVVYIDPKLYEQPVLVGDRSENIQDGGAYTAGTRFVVEGSTLRLFMQWGTGLPAQHLDMDLSASLIYDTRVEVCSFSRLVATGCRHSGDIRSIPHEVGTAEYIDMNLDVLETAGVRYVAFSCNAYSTGSLSPNLVVGWMNSRYPMQISQSSGVAYDPSCVQHQVRIAATLQKGLVFGVLEIKTRSIIWLELPFSGQVAQQMKLSTLQSLLRKLAGKLTYGDLLELRALAQGSFLSLRPEDAVVYGSDFARDPLAVQELFPE